MLEICILKYDFKYFIVQLSHQLFVTMIHDWKLFSCSSLECLLIETSYIWYCCNADINCLHVVIYMYIYSNIISILHISNWMSQFMRIVIYSGLFSGLTALAIFQRFRPIVVWNDMVLTPLIVFFSLASIFWEIITACTFFPSSVHICIHPSILLIYIMMSLWCPMGISCYARDQLYMSVLCDILNCLHVFYIWSFAKCWYQLTKGKANMTALPELLTMYDIRLFIFLVSAKHFNTNCAFWHRD